MDRSSLTWIIDRPSVKEFLLPFSLKITYYEATFGPFTTLQSLMGLVASTYIVWSGVRFYRRGYKREAGPLLLAMGFVYAAAVNDTFVSNGLYQFVYTIEYAYLAMILLMAYSLSSMVVEAAMAKEALRKSEERFRSLVETTSDWVWEIDRNGVYTYVSPKVSELLGYAPEEIIGKTPFDLMPPDEAQHIGAILRDVVASQKPFERLENTARRKDGQLVVLETSGVPFFDANGRLLGYRGIDRNITEREQTEESLRASEDKFSKAFHTSPDSININRLSDGLYIEINQGFTAITGYTADDVKGKTSLELDIWANPEDRAHLIQGLRARGGVTNLEASFRMKDGRIRIGLMSARIIQVNEEPCILSIVRDITERKRAEAQLERTLRETRVRFEISQALAGAETEDEVLDVLIQRAGLYPQAFVALVTFDRTGDELVAVERRADPFESGVVSASPVGTRFPASRFPMLRLLSADRPFVSHDIVSDERIDPPIREGILQMKTASLAAFPLTVGSEWMGYIAVFAKPAGYFDEEKQHLYQTLAEQGAVALRAARLRETIRESQQRFQGLVETLSDWIWEVDQNGAYTYVSPKAQDLLGYEPKEVLGKTPFDLMPPEEARRVAGVFGPLLAAQQPLVALENTNRHKDGHLVVFETSGVPFFDAEGRFKGYRGTDRDITERKRAERLLQTLNTAALAMQKALRPEEMFSAVSKELQKIGFSCVILATDSGRQHLIVKHRSFPSRAVQVAERVTGHRIGSAFFPVNPVDAFRKAVLEKQSVFVQNTEEVIRQQLPAPFNRLASITAQG